MVVLDIERAIPIREDALWQSLSFTREHTRGTSTWTGKLRRSLGIIDDDNGRLIEAALTRQNSAGGVAYPLDDDQVKLLDPVRVRRADRDVAVTLPDDSEDEVVPTTGAQARESHQVQATIADIGNQMGLAIWIPRNDKSAVLREMRSQPENLLERLPLNYDDATLTTIENIDVLWIRGRSIVRAFEVEHTTSIYSGILRMADLLALQPNMDIRLHIVAPASKREKVFQELRRPVFSLLERGPLAEACTYLSYDALADLAKEKHIGHMGDTILDEYAEEVD